MKRSWTSALLVAAAVALVPVVASGDASTDAASPCPYARGTNAAPETRSVDGDEAPVGCPFRDRAARGEGCPFGGDRPKADAGETTAPETPKASGGGCPYASGERAAEVPVDPMRERDKV
jgi:hypothetical protein